MLYFNKDSGDAVFNRNGMDILNIDLNNINLRNNFDEDYIVLITLLAWHIKFKKREKLKKEPSEKLIPVAWHSDRRGDWCVSEDEKKEINAMFY